MNTQQGGEKDPTSHSSVITEIPIEHFLTFFSSNFSHNLKKSHFSTKKEKKKALSTQIKVIGHKLHLTTSFSPPRMQIFPDP